MLDFSSLKLLLALSSPMAVALVPKSGCAGATFELQMDSAGDFRQYTALTNVVCRVEESF